MGVTQLFAATDQTAEPQAGDDEISDPVSHDWGAPNGDSVFKTVRAPQVPLAPDSGTPIASSL